MVVYHGHGPSTMAVRNLEDSLEAQYNVQLLNCYGDGDSDGLGLNVDHAGKNETSLVMHLYPQLVHMEYLSADRDQWPIGVGGFDPRLYASKDFGKKAFEYKYEIMRNRVLDALKQQN